MSPWFTDHQAALWGNIGGSAIGLLGGILGTAAGIAGPRGKARGFVIPLMGVMLALGIVCLLAGGAALLVRQPYGVWYPLILGGGIMTLVDGILLPIVRNAYRQADARRLEAEELRRA